MQSSCAFLVPPLCVLHYCNKVRKGCLTFINLLVMSELQHVLRLSPRQSEVLVLVPVALLIKFPGKVLRPGSDLCLSR